LYQDLAPLATVICDIVHPIATPVSVLSMVASKGF
jgi:hypothetical protein